MCMRTYFLISTDNEQLYTKFADSGSKTQGWKVFFRSMKPRIVQRCCTVVVLVNI